MASLFSKHGILSGRIDHYCLICSEPFTNEQDTLAHIVDSQHKENLKTCGYFEKYKEDFIRKTQGIYFCEPCSLTFPTATKVELHIDEPAHITEKNKTSSWLTRVENDIIAFNQFIISDDAWNGCVEDTCVLCNTEFDDSSSHKIIRSHVFNVIKSEVIFDNVQNTVYRKIDDRSKQCLTCNVIIGNDPTSHFKTVDHKEAYKLYDPTIQNNETKIVTSTTKNTNQTQNVKVKIDKTDKNDGINVVSGNVNEHIKKEAGINVNKEVKKDTTKDACKDTKESVGNDVKKDANSGIKKEVTKTVDKEKVNVQPKPSATKRNAEELDKILCKNLGAKNYITDATGNGDRWCVLCEWLLVDTPENHIRSMHHQHLLKLHRERLEEKNKNITSKDEGSSIYESVDRYQNSNVNIDLISETAFCKKCSKTIDFNTHAIEKHIEEHKKTSNKKSPETLSSGITSNGTDRTILYTKPVLLDKDKRSPKTVSIGEYAKQHGFTHNRADYSYYCHPCSRRLSATLDDLQKHVASRIHTENTKPTSKSDAREAPVKVPLFGFIKTFELVETKKDGIAIVINDKYWFNIFGFFLIAKKNEKIFCHACHIDLTIETILPHIILSDNHRGIVEKCLLITSLENEFIREIKLDLYHCGYCNITRNDWDDTLDHIATAEHKREKSKAEKNVREHQPNLLCRFNMRRIEDMIQQLAQHHRI